MGGCLWLWIIRHWLPPVHDQSAPHAFYHAAIPSVSALPDHQEHIRAAAKWLDTRMRTAGLEVAGLCTWGIGP